MNKIANLLIKGDISLKQRKNIILYYYQQAKKKGIIQFNFFCLPLIFSHILKMF